MSSSDFDDDARALLMNASRVIAQHGLDAFTLELLAKETNVPLAELTRRWPDRKNCLHDMVLLGMFDMAATIRSAAATATDGADALTRTMSAMTYLWLDRIDLFRQIIFQRQIYGSSYFGDPDERRVMPRINAAIDVMENLLKEEMADVHADIDPRRLAFSTLVTSMGLITLRGLSISGGVPLRHEDDALIRDTCRALGTTLRSMRQLAALNATATNLARVRTEEELAELVPTAVEKILGSVSATFLLRPSKEMLAAQDGKVVLIKYESRDEGALVVRGRSLDKGDESCLETFATMVGIALENVRLYENLQQELDARTEKLRETLVRLGETEKMAALGKLVAGVVHEVNSPASAIVSGEATLATAVTKLRETSNLEPAGQRIVGIIEQSSANVGVGVRRLLDVFDQLKRFTRLDGADLERADLLACVRDASTVLERELGKEQHVVIEESALPPVLCYPRRLNQVFVDVLRLLLQVGGHITRITGAMSGARAVLVFEDTSRILPSEELASIFVPTFTTKDGRVRAGYGLATAYLVVKDHGGEIRVESGTGGTRVTIELPLDGPPT